MLVFRSLEPCPQSKNAHHEKLIDEILASSLEGKKKVKSEKNLEKLSNIKSTGF
jgi:hypothetical protein